MGANPEKLLDSLKYYAVMSPRSLSLRATHWGLTGKIFLRIPTCAHSARASVAIT